MLLRELLNRFLIRVVKALGHDDLYHHDLVPLLSGALNAVTFERKLGAACGLVEGEGDGMLDVLSAWRFGAARAAACASGASAGLGASAEELVEDAAHVAGVEVEVFDADAGAGAPLRISSATRLL